MIKFDAQRWGFSGGYICPFRSLWYFRENSRHTYMRGCLMELDIRKVSEELASLILHLAAISCSISSPSSYLCRSFGLFLSTRLLF